MLLKYKKNTDWLTLTGLTSKDIAAIEMALTYSGESGNAHHEKLAKEMELLLDEFERDAKSGIIRR